LPSDVAVMVAAPSPTAVAVMLSPVVAFSVSTLVALDDHVTVRPVSRLPFASRSSAVNVWVSPGFRSTVAGTIFTDATGVRTVTVAVPSTPSAVAVMVAVPSATAVPETFGPLVLASENTFASLVFHVIGLPVMMAPFASRSSAVNDCVPPGVSVAVFGTSVTLATRGCTVSCALPLTPSTVAVMVAVPGPAPVAVVVAPLAGLSVATAPGDALHDVDRPVSVVPSAAFAVAVN